MHLKNRKIRIFSFANLVLLWSLWIPVWITTIFIKNHLLSIVANWGPAIHAFIIILLSILLTYKRIHHNKINLVRTEMIDSNCSETQITKVCRKENL